MVKSLSERIAERIRTKQPSRAGRNRAAFLAVKDEVRKALDDGWSVKVIWETLRAEGKIEVGYDAFTGYVNRLIRNAEKPAPLPSLPSASKPKAEAAGKETPAEPKKSEPPKIGGFTFDATPKKEDLF
jgi:hypothetical protein